MTSTNKSLANSGGRGHPFPASIVRGFCLVGGERVKDAVEVGQASVDAITFEMVRHKLYMVIAEAMDALQNVSSSPSTSEALDMMVSHYDRDGNLMLGGVGFARGDPASQRSDRTTETRQQS
jgi:hypothetical protein